MPLHTISFTARCQGRTYLVRTGPVRPARQRFAQVVGVPEEARNVHFYKSLKPC